MSAPPFAYYGGKTMLADRIVALMPAHDFYVEPFAGSLSVLFAKPRSVSETVNDMDGDLVNFWTVLRNQPRDLERVCALTPHSRREHAGAWSDDPVDDLERARRTWVQLTQNHGRQRHHKAGWWHMQGPNVGMGAPGYLAAYVNRMATCAERLAGVSLENRPGLDLIRDYGRFPETLLYVDPPYFGKRALGYRVEMTDESEHGALLDMLRSCTASVILSGYASDLYDAELSDWRRVEIRSGTGQGGKERSERTEVLWFNYEPTHAQGALDFGGVA